MLRCWLLIAVLLALTPCGSIAQTSNSQSGDEVAARYRGNVVTFEQLDALIIARHADAKLGRETRLFMLKLLVVDALALEAGVAASEEEINAMLAEIELGVQQSGSASNIDEYLRQQGVPRAEFIEGLRLAVLQKKLAQRGLGIPAGEPITGEQQEMWLDARIAERGLEEPPAPWADNVVVRNGNVTLLRDDFIPFLRNRLEPAVIETMLVDLLRVQRMRARMPDLDPKTLASAIDNEIAQRRAEVAKNPKYKGLNYERLLASQGILFDSWQKDPNVVKAALARLWIQRNHNDESLRGVYENERAFFDSEFGEALEAYVCFLQAAEYPNELIPLNHDQAEKKLLGIAEKITSFADFQNAVGLHSQNRASRERDGFLGWVTRTGSKGPSPARAALFMALDSGHFKPTDPADSITRLTGPVRTKTGVLLLWIGKKRPKPSWNHMLIYVRQTLRERFIEESVVIAQVTTYLQPE